MTSIYLIQHGQLEYGNESHSPLSPLGKKQAARLGNVLAQRLGSVDSIYHGDHPSQLMTMEYCLPHFVQLRHHIELDKCWQDYDHQHVMTCHNPLFATVAGAQSVLSQADDPKQAFEQQAVAALQRWMSGDFDQQYQQSWPAFKARVEQGLAHLVAQAQGRKHILVFTSGGPIALICKLLLGLSDSQFVTFSGMLNNCSVTKLYISRRGPIFSSFNEHSWFEGQFYHLLSYR